MKTHMRIKRMELFIKKLEIRKEAYATLGTKEATWRIDEINTTINELKKFLGMGEEQ